VRARIAIATLPVFLACGGSGARPETAAPGGPVEGTYEYVANLPGQEVRGMLQVVGDTILLNPVSEYCRLVMGPPDPLYIKYTCQGTGSYEQIQLTIDRRNPVQLSKWSATFRVQRRREVCVQYAVRDGRQICVQTTTETYEATETRSGNLSLRRAPS
jgi:hypothetical protein